MREYCFTVESDKRRLTVRYLSRELTFIVLGEPLLPAATEFKQAVGLWDNFSVAHGMNVKAWTIKSRTRLLQAACRLRSAIEADRELLQYDYQYSFSSRPKQRNSAGMGVGKVDGKDSGIDARNPGQIYLKLTEKGPDGKYHVVEIRDLRKGPPIITEEMGVIKVYRRKNKVDWAAKLTSLIEFLESSDSETVRIRHHYPE